MGALQVIVFVTSVVLVLESGSWVVEAKPTSGYTYSISHGSSSNSRGASPAASRGNTAAAAGSRSRGEYSVTDYRRYKPVEDTADVREANEKFFDLYEKQLNLIKETRENGLTGPVTNEVDGGDEDYYYYDDGEEYEEYEDDDEEEEEEEDSEEEEEEDDDDEEEEDSEEEDEDDEDEEDSDEEDEDEEDSDEEDSDSSSSSEEDDYDDSSSSSEEDGEDSSSSEEDGEDSSSSSSSSSSEEDDGYSALHNLPVANLQPVTDTPEVKQAKEDFFNLYKAQAELSFNAPDH